MASLLLLLPCCLLAAAQDPPAPQLFTAEFVTDISDTPIIIEVHLYLGPAYACNVSPGDSVPGTPGR